MYRTDFNPFSECFRFFSSFACCGPWSGRRFYTRKERIEALEKLKKQLQDEINAVGHAHFIGKLFGLSA